MSWLARQEERGGYNSERSYYNTYSILAQTENNLRFFGHFLDLDQSNRKAELAMNCGEKGSISLVILIYV
ncbi:predicted protein [Sclerotinia sclerotiorum 1980 UF-70]|uniref:Uncharacterized protein n=1 Tax=Sclerotinia sclerotiorum (strain ATCC 18683 / 1980 / Ss-1) TaxID=665079 RepID=A7F997_SCLS1|nr:predicted protein [Sclerotinia sclerotiorum 1980 UF-70]EDO00308.1 predicted protein [Sclerotinia sclerotiorum 1980 UF-70]